MGAEIVVVATREEGVELGVHLGREVADDDLDIVSLPIEGGVDIDAVLLMEEAVGRLHSGAVHLSKPIGRSCFF